MPVHVEAVRPNRSAAWTTSDAIAADETAPTTSAHGVATGGLTNMLCGVSAMTAITDYSMVIWAMDADDVWAVVAEFLNLGARAFKVEVDLADFADGGRAMVQIVDLAGTSLKKKYRFI